MIVVDASSWVDRLVGRMAEPLRERVDAESCAAPPHVDFEVGSVLLRLERRGAIEPGQARRLIDRFSRNPVERVRQPIDATEAVDLVNNASYADAWYIALARRLGCALMTSDAGMKTAAGIHNVQIIDAIPRAE